MLEMVRSTSELCLKNFKNAPWKFSRGLGITIFTRSVDGYRMSMAVDGKMSD
jgi:hypothetical protein